ncbi:MAG: N-acetyltransferase family protein [Saprospiraceae bacterium]
MNYPIQFITPIQLADGTLIQLRPIHPDDGRQALPFREKLSEESIRSRFLGYIPSFSQKLVKQLTIIDYKNEMAIVAETVAPAKREVIAVARVVREKDTDTAEFAIIIVDEWHGRGLGGRMTDFMVEVAQQMKFKRLYALLYSHNQQMREIFKRKGFTLHFSDESTSCAELIFADVNDEVSDFLKKSDTSPTKYCRNN